MKQIVLNWKARLHVVVWAGSLLLGITSMAKAHSDPWGDIHPHVSVLDGKFSIVFNTKVPDQNDDYSDAQPVNRMIFNHNGTLFSPRHPLDKKRAWDAHGSVELSGREIRLGNDTLIFRGSDGQPGYFLRAFDGRTAEVRLPWPKDVSLVLFEDVMVTPAGIAITGRHADSSVEGESLYFYWFAHEETTTGTVVRIGPTACIYDFPVASNIVFAGGRFWLAYMGEEKDLKLMLWSWKPGEEEGRVEALDSPADWNSHLSMAAIGNRLCLAYHCVVNEKAEMRNHASIVTVFRNAE
jgi:hypothetical protein